MLGIGDWEQLLDKIQKFKEDGVNLTDHIAIANKQKVEKKALLMENLRAAKTKKPESESKDTSVSEEDSASDIEEKEED